MNILHILNNSYNPDPRVEKELRSITSKINDCKVTLLCVEGERKDETIPNLEILRFLPKTINQYHKLNVSRIIKELSKKIKFNDFDLIHAHDQTALHIASLIKNEHSHLKLIYDAHEYIKGWKLYQRDKNLWKKFKGYIVHQKFVKDEQKDIKNNVNEIITVSYGLKDLYSSFNIKTTVIRNAPSHQHCVDSNTDIRSSLGITKSDTLIVHSGWPYYSEKMLATLFKTIEDLPTDYKLCIICGGDGWTRILKKYNISHLIGEKLFHHEFVPYNELSSFLSSADIGLILTYNPKWSSFWYSMPNKLFDYSNAGLALIATNQPEFNNFIKENKNGISFDPNKENGLREAILVCSNELDQFKNNSSLNRNKNDWKNEEQKLIEVYKSLFSLKDIKLE